MADITQPTTETPAPITKEPAVVSTPDAASTITTPLPPQKTVVFRKDQPPTVPPEVVASQMLPKQAKELIRHRLDGKMHLCDEICKLVDGSGVDESLTAFIQSEIKKLKTNAVKVHCHVLDNPDGSVSVDIHIIPKTLG